MSAGPHPPAPSPLTNHTGEGELFGQTVLVTRPAKQAAGLVEPLEALGATVFLLPAIEIAPPLDPEPLDEALRNLDRYDWLVLTSVNGVEALRERARALGVVEAVVGCRIAAVGPSTAKAAREAFREPDLVPEEYVGEAVAAALGEVRGRRFLLARADIARDDLPRRLREGGATVDDPAAYRIVRPTLEMDLPQACPDWIALTSSSAVFGTRDALAAQGRGEWMRTARLACIGPLTAATVRESGYEVAVMAEAYTIPGLVEAMVRESERAEDVTTPSPTVPPYARIDELSEFTASSPRLQGEPSSEGLFA